MSHSLPQGYSVRPTRLDDVPRLVDLLNRDAVLHAAKPEFSESDYANDLQEPGFSLDDDARVVLASDGVIAGVAEYVCYSPYVRPFAWVRVHPEHVGRGIGRWLLLWVEARARERLEMAPADARVTLYAGAQEKNQWAQTLFSSLGFDYARTFCRMGVTLDAPPATPVWPAGITLHTMVSDVDDRAVYRAIDEAFEDHWGHVAQPFEDGFARWRHNVRSDLQFDPSLNFIALDGEEIAGVAMCSPATETGVDVGWVHQLGVRRPWRKQGLGRALLLHAFAEFRARGIREVALGVDAASPTGATRLYENAGMQVQNARVSYGKILRPGVDLMTAESGR